MRKAGYAGQSNTGYQATPAAEKQDMAEQTAGAKKFEKANPLGAQTVAASQDYMAWFNDAKTKPTQASAADDMRWRVYRRITEWEGVPSAVNTYDSTNVTYGTGWAGAAGGLAAPVGKAEVVTATFMKMSPDAAKLFNDAGMTVDANDFVVVDPDNKFQLRGMDAELYLRTNTDLLSLMVNAAQGAFVDPNGPDDMALPMPGEPANPDRYVSGPGAQMRQAALDANFQVFIDSVSTGKDLGSDVDLAALKLHATMSGNINWGQVSGFGSIPDLVKFIYKSQSKGVADAVVVPPNWRAMAPTS
jgi:hypothetical protein